MTTVPWPKNTKEFINGFHPHQSISVWGNKRKRELCELRCDHCLTFNLCESWTNYRTKPQTSQKDSIRSRESWKHDNAFTRAVCKQEEHAPVPIPSVSSFQSGQSFRTAEPHPSWTALPLHLQRTLRLRDSPPSMQLASF